MTDVPVSGSVSEAIKVLCSRWDHLQSQQEWMRDNTNLYDQCPVLDEYISEKLKNSSYIGGHKTDNIPKDITPLDNDVMLLKVWAILQYYITSVICLYHFQHAFLIN